MRFILSIYCICLPFLLEAQAAKGWEFGIFAGYGSNVKHNNLVTLPIHTYKAWSIEGFAELQTYGKKSWHQSLNYPQIGVSYRYLNFGNNRQLGHAIGVSPYIIANFWKNKHWQIYGSLALGFGYLSRYYHPKNNPENNSIGSHFNNNTVLGLGISYRLDDFWQLRMMGSFTHFSNAASQFPNLGINTVLLQLGVAYRPFPVVDTAFRRHELPFIRPLSGQVYGSLGVRESSTSGGPKYPIALFSAELNYAMALAHRLSLGMEYEWNGSAYAFLRNIGVLDEKEAFKEASRWSLKVGEEILMGRFSLNIQIGFYLSRHQLQPWISYTRATAKYHLYPTLHKNINPYIGISMKAHLAAAEYFSVLLGCRF